MAINPIQFQKGLSLSAFWQRYGTEAQCAEALIEMRWPEGFVCPCCGARNASRYLKAGLRYWQCGDCRHQTSLYSGTLFAHTRLKLTQWFLAIYLLTQSKTNMAALELKRHLGVSWKTAWLVKHKLMEAMFQRERGQSLSGDVVIDDAYLGGERTGGKAGRGSENKVPFVAAVEMKDGRPQRVRFDRVDAFSFKALTHWSRQAVAPGSSITSDGLLGFEVLRTLGFQHQAVLAPKGKAGTEIEPFRWMNVLLGNLKTSLSGTYHAFDFKKYGHRYLAEVQYRFNRRFDLATLVPRLATAAIHANPCPAWKIRSAAEIGT